MTDVSNNVTDASNNMMTDPKIMLLLIMDSLRLVRKESIREKKKKLNNDTDATLSDDKHLALAWMASL
jgi:hypothetical protein